MSIEFSFSPRASARDKVDNKIDADGYSRQSCRDRFGEQPEWQRDNKAMKLDVKRWKRSVARR